MRGFGIGVALVPASADKICEGLNYNQPMEDIMLIPDKASFRVCPWNKEIGLVFFREETLDGAPFDLCPRTLLMKACRELKQAYKIEVRIGIELEFTILKRVCTTTTSLLEGEGQTTWRYDPVEASSYSTSKSLLIFEEDFMEISE